MTAEGRGRGRPPPRGLHRRLSAAAAGVSSPIGGIHTAGGGGTAHPLRAPRAGQSRELRDEGRELRAESRELRAESRESGAESRETRVEGRESGAESRELRAES